MTSRAVVVGAGLGGLAAGCLLASRGVRTTVLEKNAEVGGCASGRTVDGFRFDVGATIVEVPSVIEDLFELIGRRLSDYVHLISLDPVYTVRFADGSSLPFRRSAEEMAGEVGRLSPRDVPAFRRYLEETDRLKRDLKRLFVTRGFGRWLDVCSRPGLRVFSSLAPWSSVERRARGLFGDPRLRDAFSFQVMYFGISPRDCPAVYSMVPYFELTRGVFHPHGGVARLAEALAEVFGELGGELRRSSPVAEIEVAGGAARGVRLASGETIAADAVIANTDAVYTYSELLPGLRRPGRLRRRLDRYRLSCSTHLMLLGLDSPRGDLGHHTFFLPADSRACYRAIFERESLPPELAAYACCASRSEPALAPDGCEALYVLTPVPRRLAGARWSRQAAEEFADVVIDRLEERGVAGLRRQIVSRTVLSPSDYESLFNLPQGMTFGLQPVLSQMGPLRPRVRSPWVRGLFLAGASVHPGAGIPLVLASARSAAAEALTALGRPALGDGSG